MEFAEADASRSEAKIRDGVCARQSARQNRRPILNGSFVHVTDEEDPAAVDPAALEKLRVGHGRFDALFIAGEENEREPSLSKAERLLGWKPRSHRLLNE